MFRRRDLADCYVFLVSESKMRLVRAKEDAQFLYFRGQKKLKTVKPYILEKKVRGRKQAYNVYWVQVSDPHTYDPQTGDILSEDKKEAIKNKMVQDTLNILLGLLKAKKTDELKQELANYGYDEETLQEIIEGKRSLFEIATKMVQIQTADATPHMLTDQAINLAIRSSYWEGFLLKGRGGQFHWRDFLLGAFLAAFLVLIAVIAVQGGFYIST